MELTGVHECNKFEQDTEEKEEKSEKSPSNEQK